MFRKYEQHFISIHVPPLLIVNQCEWKLRLYVLYPLLCHGLQLPNVGDVWSYYMDFDTKRLDSWERIVPAFRFDKETPFFELLVPTIDTVRYGYLMEKLLEVNMSVLYTGGTGVGKSMVAKGLLQSVSEKLMNTGT